MSHCEYCGMKLDADGFFRHFPRCAVKAIWEYRKKNEEEDILDAKEERYDDCPGLLKTPPESRPEL